MQAGMRLLRATDGRTLNILCLLGVFAVALLLRTVHLVQIQQAPLSLLKMGDAASYDAWARQIAAGNWRGDKVFYQAPLYPYVLAAIYGIFGDTMLAVRIVQALISSTSCVCLACAGMRIFSLRTGVLAGLLLACYAPAIFYDGLVQKSVLDTFFLSLGLCVLGGILENPSKARWTLLGLVMGALALTRENALVIAAVLVLWLLYRYRSRGVLRPLFAACFLAGMSLVLLPVAVRNKMVGGEFHLTTSQFGPNFYIGNHEKADGLYQPLRSSRDNPTFERQDATEIAEQALGKKLSPGEVSRYWTERALAYIRSNPLAWSKLMMRKLALALNVVEIFDVEDYYTYQDWSSPLRWSASLFHFGMLAPLATFGIWATWDRRDKLWILYVIPAAYLASISLFYIFGRYRLPLVPVLVLFAAAGLTRAKRTFRESSAVGIAVGVAVTSGAFMLCNLPIIASRVPMRAMTYYNIGTELYNRGEYDLAIDSLRAALKLQPDLSDAHNNLGLISVARGDMAQAVEYFTKAVAADKENINALLNLGRAKLKAGDLQSAERYFRNALKVDPQNSQALEKLTYIKALRHYVDHSGAGS
jgi:4-amino-4-deoxy-L-arabinose transferase-like glycosyltransferase